MPQQRFFSRESYGSGDVHIWFGPLGLHLYAPDFWNSRADWCSNWRAEVSSEPQLEEVIGKGHSAKRIVESVKPKHLAPAFALMGLAGYVLPMIQAVLASTPTT